MRRRSLSRRCRGRCEPPAAGAAREERAPRRDADALAGPGRREPAVRRAVRPDARGAGGRRRGRGTRDGACARRRAARYAPARAEVARPGRGGRRPLVLGRRRGCPRRPDAGRRAARPERARPPRIRATRARVVDRGRGRAHLLARTRPRRRVPADPPQPAGDKHVAAARWVEEIAGERVEDHAGILAYHYGEAVELAAGGRRGAARDRGPPSACAPPGGRPCRPARRRRRRAVLPARRRAGGRPPGRARGCPGQARLDSRASRRGRRGDRRLRGGDTRSPRDGRGRRRGGAVRALQYGLLARETPSGAVTSRAGCDRGAEATPRAGARACIRHGGSQRGHCRTVRRGSGAHRRGPRPGGAARGRGRGRAAPGAVDHARLQGRRPEPSTTCATLGTSACASVSDGRPPSR